MTEREKKTTRRERGAPEMIDGDKGIRHTGDDRYACLTRKQAYHFVA